MDPVYCTLIGCLAAIGGLVVGWLGAWLLDRSRLQGVHARAVEVAAAAKVEADQIVGDMLARARQFGIAAPILTAAYAHLAIYLRRLAAA